MFCDRFPPPGAWASEAVIRAGARAASDPLHARLAKLQTTQFGARLLDQRLRLGASDLGDVILIFQEHPKRIGDLRGVKRDRIEFGQRGRPVERLSDAGRLEEVLFAKTL